MLASLGKCVGDLILEKPVPEENPNSVSEVDAIENVKSGSPNGSVGIGPLKELSEELGTMSGGIFDDVVPDPGKALEDEGTLSCRDGGKGNPPGGIFGRLTSGLGLDLDLVTRVRSSFLFMSAIPTSKQNT